MVNDHASMVAPDTLSIIAAKDVGMVEEVLHRSDKKYFDRIECLICDHFFFVFRLCIGGE